MMKKEKIIVLQNIRHLESHLIIKGLNSKGQILSFFAGFALKSRKKIRQWRLGAGRLYPGRIPLFQKRRRLESPDSGPYPK